MAVPAGPATAETAVSTAPAASSTATGREWPATSPIPTTSMAADRARSAITSTERRGSRSASAPAGRLAAR